MKKLLIMQVMLACIAMTSCNNGQQKTDEVTTYDSISAVVTDSTAAFESFREHFSKSSAFAYAEMSGRKVLLVSQEVFGNNENTDLEAIEASIFALDKEGKIMALGSIRSQGTRYPVSLLDGKLMVAGHQFVKVYSIQGDVPELVLDSYEEVALASSDREGAPAEGEAQGESAKLDEMFKTFEKGTSIKFERKE